MIRFCLYFIYSSCRSCINIMSIVFVKKYILIYFFFFSWEAKSLLSPNNNCPSGFNLSIITITLMFLNEGNYSVCVYTKCAWLINLYCSD